MKQFVRLFLVAFAAGATTLGGYKYFIEKETVPFSATKNTDAFIPANLNANANVVNLDFTKAAEKTIHTVVHVKNTSINNRPVNVMEYFSGR